MSGGADEHVDEPEQEASAFVYELAATSLMAEAEDTICSALRRVLGVADPAPHVVGVSASSGWISYIDSQDVWKQGTPPTLPARAALARSAAERFMAQFGKEIERRRSALPEGLARAMIMPSVRPVQLSAVARRDRRAWDHWLYRAQPILRLTRSGPAVPVAGAQIEIRIGDGGRVVSYLARWRPPSGRRSTTSLTARPRPQTHGRGHPNRSRGLRPSSSSTSHPRHAELVYAYEGDAIPQYYLAPFYVLSDGHIETLVSASPYSLVVEFKWHTLADDMTEVMAIVSGGSGRYDFGWAAYDADDLWEGELRLLSGNTRKLSDEDGRPALVGTVRIPSGNWSVLLNVRDRETGAFRHCEQQVVTGPIIRAGGQPRVA